MLGHPCSDRLVNRLYLRRQPTLYSNSPLRMGLLCSRSAAYEVAPPAVHVPVVRLVPLVAEVRHASVSGPVAAGPNCLSRVLEEQSALATGSTVMRVRRIGTYESQVASVVEMLRSPPFHARDLQTFVPGATAEMEH